VKTAAVVLAIVGALVLQTTLSGLSLGAAATVNLVLVAVVYLALAYGPMTGMLSGMVGGLVQDALAGGIIGLGGLTKTLIGFVVGVLSAQFNLSTTVPRLAMFVVATFVHQVLLAGLSRITGGPHVGLQFSGMLLQALVNGLIGATAFVLVENGPDAVQRHRMRRATSFSKRRY
jgi:rod shape-determining protein MreD